MASYLVFAIPAVIGVAGAGYLLYRRCGAPREEAKAILCANHNNNNNNNTSVRAPSAIDFSALDIDCSPQGFFDSLMEIMHKPLLRLPISVDLPRLARKITLYDDDNDERVIEANEDADDSRALLVCTILSELSRLVGDSEQVRSTIEQQARDFITDQGDMATGIMAFFTEVLTANGVEEPKVIGVLRGCNQSTLAPAVMRLKKTLAMPYKDKRSSWLVDIHVADNRVIVTHRKIEEAWLDSYQDPAEFYFDFTWHLEVEFDRQTAQLQQVRLKIVHVTFPETASSQRRKQVLQSLSKCECAQLIYSEEGLLDD
jgi:hypothetical protein